MRKLFTLRGKEIKTLADIFRAPGKGFLSCHPQIGFIVESPELEPAFIAIGRDEVTNSILATAIQVVLRNAYRL